MSDLLAIINMTLIVNGILCAALWRRPGLQIIAGCVGAGLLGMKFWLFWGAV